MSEHNYARKRAEPSESDATANKRKKMSFDVSDPTLNDACLVVGGQKFYVSKHQLARQSDYFKVMFFGKFTESKNKQFVMKEEIDPTDFQNFLELTNGGMVLNDENVAGVCQVADVCLADLAQEHCHEFLLKKSKMSKTEKLNLTMVYHFLNDIKTQILSEIQTAADYTEIVTGGLPNLDMETSRFLLTKGLEFIANPAEIRNKRSVLHYRSNMMVPRMFEPEIH